MFTAILSTAAVMASAQGPPPVPCEPWRFQTMRLEFNSDGTTFEGVYEAQDSGSSMFKRRAKAYYDGPNGWQTYEDEYIHDGNQKKVWHVTYNASKHAVTCNVQPEHAPFQRLCLLQNASFEGYSLIAGSTASDTWVQQRFHSRNEPWFPTHQGCMVTEYYHMAQGTHIPITRNRIYHDSANPATEHVTYYNVDEDVPADAFRLPSFCPN